MQDWPETVDRIVLKTIDSTNAEAGRIAARTTRPTWILAYEQTAGRGRRGRPWSAPKGNFNATLLMHPKGPLDQVALRSFVASLALRDTFVALTGREDLFTLKWPNDVLLRGGKVAGILLESAGQGPGAQHLCVGIGVNLVAAPPAFELEPGGWAAVALKAETGLTISPETFLETLAPAFDRWERQLTTFGFEPVRNAWLRHAARLGERITARFGDQQLTGVFETVDAQGAVVLQAADGRHHISAADIFFA